MRVELFHIPFHLVDRLEVVVSAEFHCCRDERGCIDRPDRGVGLDPVIEVGQERDGLGLARQHDIRRRHEVEPVGAPLGSWSASVASRMWK